MTQTKHLTPEEFADALDGTPDERRDAHVQACDACRKELDGVRATLAEARSIGVPEPSPLFWDHFSARVQEATAAAAPASRSSWSAGWRPWVTLAGAVGAVLLALYVRPAGVPTEVTRAPAVPFSFSATDDDGTWELVLGLAAELDWSDVQQAVTPAAGTADAMIDELTAEQREAMARLLRQEMGEL